MTPLRVETPILVSMLGLVACLEPDGTDGLREDGRGFGGEEWVHDPSRLVEEDGRWVVYGSGTSGVALTRSAVDLETGRVESLPGIEAETVAAGWWAETQEWNPTGEFDAPTVSPDGRFLAFTVFDEEEGEVRDATGLAVWQEDHWKPAGVLLRSEGEAPGTARAMDASFVDTEDGLALVFGSHAGGVFLTELDPETGLLADDPQVPDTDAAPERFVRVADDPDQGIEAAMLHRHDGGYVLFVNKGQCCRGADSTYRVEVGRSADLYGPYLDREGRDLRNGGGSPFLSGSGDQRGPGHVGIANTPVGEVVSVHAYDAADSGVSKLLVREILWEDGWPVAGGEVVWQGRADAG